MLAVKKNNVKVVEELLKAGADPNLTNKLGQEAIHYKNSITWEHVEESPIV